MCILYCLAVEGCDNHDACDRFCDKSKDTCVCAKGYSSAAECKTVGELTSVSSCT